MEQKNNKKKEKFWDNYSMLAKFIREELKAEEEKYELYTKEHMSRDQREKTRKEITKKVRARAAIIGVSAAIGISGIVGAFKVGKYIGEANDKKNNIEFDQDEYGRNQVNIEIDENTVVKISEKSFDERIKVDTSNFDNIVEDFQNEQNLKSNVKNQIDNLESSEEVRDYIKQMYLNEYNSKNSTKYDLSDITLSKKKYNCDFEHKTAKNGDSILVYKDNVDSSGNEVGITKVTVGGKVVECFAWDRLTQSYKNVYETDQIEKDTPSTELAEVISLGIEYMGSIDQVTKFEKREKFTNAVEKYKENQIQQIINGKDKDR